MERDKLVDYLDQKLLARRFQKNNRDNQLIVEGKGEVNKIGIATNTSFDVINKSIEKGMDFLIVHHPSWEKQDLDNHGKKLKTLKQNGVSLYGSHDSMDCVPEIGMADTLAKLLGIKIERKFADWNITPWHKNEGDEIVKDVFVGVYGSLQNSQKIEDFVKTVERILGCKIRYWKNHNNYVKKIGIVTGGGSHSMWIQEAKNLDCDTYLSGEGPHFASIYAKETGINLILGSHYGTESVPMKELCKIIKNDLGIETVFIEEENMG